MVGMEKSILAAFGKVIAPIFVPLGWGNWQAAVATLTGLIAKENVVGTLRILCDAAGDGAETWRTALTASFTALSAFSFLAFNLLCAPCVAAISAIWQEMGSVKWFWGAIGYQCGLAYIVSLCVYQFGMLFSAGNFGGGTIAAILLAAGFLFMLFRPGRRPSG
jgi:ferrous iron transport protein B